MNRRWGTTGMLAMCLGFVAGTAMPCGPFLPNQLLLHASNAVLDAPPGDLRVELLDHALPKAKRLPCVPPTDEPEKVTAAAELADIRLLLPGATHEMAPSVAQNLQLARTAPPAERERLLHDLPDEWRLYVAGAAAFHVHDLATARQNWQALLNLPADQRKLRSTWAAFMLGKAALTDDHAAARRWFAKTRELAAQGFADSLGLALTSLGAEAQSHLLEGTPQERIVALGLYLEQARHADEGAITSVRFVARAAMTDPATARLAALQPETRRAVTAWLLAADLQDGDPKPDDYPLSRTWLDVLRQAGVTTAEGADRLAWLAYRAGRFDDAAKWLTQAPADNAMANWIRAKLALKAGKIAEGTALPRLALKSLPNAQWHSQSWDRQANSLDDELGAMTPRSKVDIELGVLALARRDYVEAFDLMARATASGAVPDVRFHYRTVAADRAMAASQLLPDSDPRAQTMLCWSRQWLLERQPVDKYVKEFRRRWSHAKWLAIADHCPQLP